MRAMCVWVSLSAASCSPVLGLGSVIMSMTRVLELRQTQRKIEGMKEEVAKMQAMIEERRGKDVGQQLATATESLSELREQAVCVLSDAPLVLVLPL